jgi:hypothetical protein
VVSGPEGAQALEVVSDTSSGNNTCGYQTAVSGDYTARLTVFAAVSNGANGSPGYDGVQVGFTDANTSNYCFAYDSFNSAVNVNNSGMGILLNARFQNGLTGDASVTDGISPDIAVGSGLPGGFLVGPGPLVFELTKSGSTLACDWLPDGINRVNIFRHVAPGFTPTAVFVGADPNTSNTRAMALLVAYHLTGGGGGPTPPANSISVTDPAHNGGDQAVCSASAHDDRAPIQATLDYAAKNKIAIVTLPMTTCYMNSSTSLAGILGNLQIPNDVTLEGTAGASKILQTPAGRAPCSYLCAATVINVGMYAVTWSKMGCKVNPCSGYSPLYPTSAGSTTVTLANPGQAGGFHAGDYVAIYDHQPTQDDDVINGIAVQVASNGDSSTGVVILKDPLARTFPSHPYIGNISKGGAQVGHDAGIKGVIVQGESPLMVTESFNFVAQDSQFIADLTMYDAAHQHILVPMWNSLEHSTFDRNQIVQIGAGGNGWTAELTQRNSGFVTFSNNTIGTLGTAGFASWGAAEYAHDMTITGNHIHLNSNGHDGCGFSIGAQNAMVSGNTFDTTGSWSQGGGGMICDVVSPIDYYGWAGNVTYSGNTIHCNAKFTPCISLAGLQKTKILGNTIDVAAGAQSGYGVLVQYFPADMHIDGNTIHVQGGDGIHAIPPSDGGWTIDHNTITAASGSIGIAVGATSYPNPGHCSVQNNTTTGFHTGYSGDPSHTGCTLGGNK